MIITRPMLAATVEDINQLRFPLLATPKIDGIRCLILGNQVNGATIEGYNMPVSRKLKIIPNSYIYNLLMHLPAGLDGEIVCPGGFNATQSAVMSRPGTPAFKYIVFDWAMTAPYYQRVGEVVRWHRVCPCAWSEALPYNQLDTLDELLAYEAQCLEAGYEGVCLRKPDGPYKMGRSTFREHYLLKLKRFLDGEAVVEDFEEQLHNENEARTNALGLSERSKESGNLVPNGVLGALWVRDTTTNNRFSIGTGFDNHQRADLWRQRDSLRGRVVSYKYQPSGMKDLPRFPVFKGFRKD